MPLQSTLYEYPVTPAAQQNPSTGQIQQHFDYDRKAATARQMESQGRRGNEPLNPAVHLRYLQIQRNDPGPIRGVTDQHGNIIGAMAHPEGNRIGFERASLQPLDKEGKQSKRTYEDYHISHRSTFPRR